ncbi:glycerophosphodiester phosphodiesterase [Bradyrhizobium sp. STM 3809]|uniref:glycerophosphodiester phosphodiesterase n=1 Tax=Bradyrhizobium sp. STM 3809 TaxID=551936 RepID=UPI0002409CBD|nr:glycerophosphodiester phosphodiesterase [Bradyrhizobium sp. STM 3809]CCD99149.1 putative glycerophosphoryl diester phosphodiesterase (modular protein) [Bradyrhizobium sp. STM 3809]
MQPLSRSLCAALLLCGISCPGLAFDIEAHRGGRALHPENTLQAFTVALALRVDTLELDVGVTRDGVLVVSHERRLNPDLARDALGHYVAPPGPLLIDLPLAEVQSYDVGQIRPGSDYAKQFPEQRVLTGELFPSPRIPTLKQVIDLVRRSGKDQVRLNIETKLDPAFPSEAPDPERFVSLLLDLIAAEHFADRVMIQSFDWRILQLVQQRAPRIPTVYLSRVGGKTPTVSLTEATRWTAGFNPADHGQSLPRTIHTAGGKVWSPYYTEVTPELISEAHALGLQVVVWTVNKPEDMAQLIDIGVDGIISDWPNLLRQVAADKGLVKPMGQLHIQRLAPGLPEK